MKTKKLTPGGFTIVEALVAIVLAGVLIGTLTQVVTTYVHLAKRGRYLNLANSFVEAKVEALRNSGYNALTIGTASLNSELPSQLPPGKSASMVTTQETGLKRIVITVAYNDNGQSNSYSYTTLIGELGVGQ